MRSNVQTIDIAGGLTADASGDFATIGDVLVEREDGETVEAFRVRAREAAVAAGRDHVIFGGLPAMRFEEGETENGTTD
jgi:hypothetical protein